MNNEKEIIIQTYRDYVQAFQTLDPEAILPYIHAPYISVTSREVIIMATPLEIKDSFARNMKASKQIKYARTDIAEIHAKLMSKGLALVSVHLERYTTDGERIGGPGRTYTYTYTLRKIDDHWKIVVNMAHDSENIIRFDYKPF